MKYITLDEKLSKNEDNIREEYSEKEILDAIKAKGEHPMFLSREETLKMTQNLRKVLNLL